MNITDKQIMTALVYIKNNPDCTTRATDLDENIVHYLYEHDLVNGRDTLSSSSDKGAKHEYSFLTIETQGEIYIETHNQKKSFLNIFNNKTVRFVIATIFIATVGLASKLVYDTHKINQEQGQVSPSKLKGEVKDNVNSIHKNL